MIPFVPKSKGGQVLITLFLAALCFPFVSAALTDSLTDVWTFNEDNANVYWNNSIVGRQSLLGSFQTQTVNFAGKSGKAVHINCYSSSNCINNTMLMAGHAKATVCFWYKNLSTANADSVLWTYYKDNGNRVQSNYRAGGAYVLNWYNAQTSEGTCDVTTTVPTATSAWRSACLVMNGTHFIQYFNGSKVYDFACTPDFKGISGATTRMILGKFGGGGGTKIDFDIDEMYIWNRTLSSSEITDLQTQYYPFGAITATATLILKNTSGNTKTTFTEKEGFKAYASFVLSNGSVLASAKCNVTATAYSLKNMAFNATSSQYRNDTWFNYTAHGSKTFTLKCSQGTYSDSDVVGVTINNIAPTAKIEMLLLNGSSYNFTALGANPQVEYLNGRVNATGIVVDDDVDKVRWQLRNISGNIVKSQVTNAYSKLVFNSSLIARAGKYNLSLRVNDTASASSYHSVTFRINDTGMPDCDGLHNEMTYSSILYSWAVNCSDQYFYSLNITCDNGYSFYQQDIDATKFSMADTTIISTVAGAMVCDYEYCDGHTASRISPMDVSVSKRDVQETVQVEEIVDGKPVLKDVTYTKQLPTSISFEGLELAPDKLLLSLDYWKLPDRYSFCFGFDKGVEQVKIPIPEGCLPAENSKYAGHLTCRDDRVWIDFVNSDVQVKVQNGMVVLDISKVKDKGSVCFSSVGKFNCVSGQKAVVLSEDDSKSMTAAVWFAVFVFIWLFFVAISLMATGVHGKRMGILGFIQLGLGAYTAIAAIPFFGGLGASVIGCGAVIVFIIVVTAE